MKVPVLSSLLLLLGLSSQLPAIERPKSLDATKPKERPAQQVGKPEAIPQVQRAWLGVLSEQASQTLTLHLGLDAGVVLSYVAPDSPASKGGLLEHDILTKVDGNVIGNQDALREEILTHEPGDEVKVSIIRKGKPEEVKVTLGQRPQVIPQAPDRQLIPRGGKLGDLDLKRFEGLNDLPQGEQLQQHLENQMKRLEEQLRDMEQRGGLKLDLRWLDKLPKPENGGIELDFKSSSSFKFFDEHGSVEMKRSDGGREVVVRDKGGKLLFEGPWDTPQDKAGAPDDIRERIEQMNDGNQFHFRLENVPEPDLEIPDKKQPKLE